MHVLVTADTIGGVWSYTREVVTGLLQRGHEVTLVSLGRIPSEENSSWTRATGLTFCPTEFPLEWMPDSEAGVAASIRHIASLISEFKPDILHSSQFCYGALPCGIPKVVVAHSDVVSWWHAVHGCAPPSTRWSGWYRSLVTAGLSAADVVVAPSQWMLEAINRHYDRLRCGKVIRNGRSSGLFHAASRKISQVLSVGRIWDEGKQISLLLARNHSTAIMIAGNADHPSGTGSAGWVRPKANVTMCGEKGEEALRALYSRSSTYVATSRYEPFGLAPLEAALSRCALVVNDIPSFREVWGDAGVYFQQNDADSLAAAIELLSGATDMCEEYADRAYSHAIRHYTAERMVDQYEALYESLLGAGVNA